MKFDTSGGTEAPPKKEFPLLDPGTYQFVVLTAVDAVSRAGNKMVTIEIRAFDMEADKDVKIKDYLVGTESASWKVKQFLKGIGDPEAAESGELDAEAIINQGGMVVVGKKEPNDKGYVYNEVVAYVDPDEEPAEAPRKAIGEDPDEDPFS